MILVERCEGNSVLGRLGVQGSMTSMWVWHGLIWLRAGTSGSCELVQFPKKMWGVS